ncbi:MAG: beta-galactosidase, partial [Muribaculaceae bacterium]|nr:beta-galactosidase [Muribaculaceae bacterium]
MFRRFIAIGAISILVNLPEAAALNPRTPDYLILGGELGNSSASSKEDIRTIFPKLKDMGLNTVLMPVYWELSEPIEGKYDFSLLDEAIATAKRNDLKLVLLWFGAWKNSMSCYAPGWVKTDTRRFPRAVTEKGKPLEILSAFSEEVLKSDLKAFDAMLDHLKANDSDNVVVMIQIENEIGMLESARDHSELAEKIYSKGIPESLAVRLDVKPGTDWKKLAEDEDYADEMFMAWHYARYVENLAKTAREKLPSTPLYVNAALDSRGRRPGQYPSAGPIARLSAIWKAGAPSVDFISPDLYDPPFAPWLLQYDFRDNPLFIPEIRRSTDSGTHAFYAIGEHNAIGFSPFSVSYTHLRDHQ